MGVKERRMIVYVSVKVSVSVSEVDKGGVRNRLGSEFVYCWGCW